MIGKNIAVPISNIDSEVGLAAACHIVNLNGTIQGNKLIISPKYPRKNRINVKINGLACLSDLKSNHNLVS